MQISREYLNSSLIYQYMKKYLAIIASLICLSPNVHAELCKKNFYVSIKMDDDWNQKEQQRLENENILLNKYSDHITKQAKPLIAEPYSCAKDQECDEVKNCQMETRRSARTLREMEYSMKIDSGLVIAKSHCSLIGKCIGYNDFFHTNKVTASEDRLIDIKQNHALFYHYFYSGEQKSYQPPFNMTSFNNGSELYFNDIPHFSPDEKVIVEVRSIPKQELSSGFPTGFNINIYELNEAGEYKNVEPAEIDPQNPEKILSTFLSRNPSCGATPHFHSWKSNKEIRLSTGSGEGKKVILFYDEKLKKWSCKDDVNLEFRCEPYFPGSTSYSSNLAMEQINDCR
jgi:hypothetical protein